MNTWLSAAREKARNSFAAFCFDLFALQSREIRHDVWHDVWNTRMKKRMRPCFNIIKRRNFLKYTTNDSASRLSVSHFCVSLLMHCIIP